MKKFISDVKHISWLAKTGIICFIKCDFDGSRESWFWIKMHCNYQINKTK